MEAISIATLPDLLNVLDWFLLIALLLLGGLAEFITRVANLLDAVIDLSQFHFRRIVGRYDLSYGLFHRLALADETLQRVVLLLAVVFPELTGIPRGKVTFINERDVCSDFTFG